MDPRSGPPARPPTQPAVELTEAQKIARRYMPERHYPPVTSSVFFQERPPGMPKPRSRAGLKALFLFVGMVGGAMYGAKMSIQGVYNERVSAYVESEAQKRLRAYLEEQKAKKDEIGSQS